MASTQREARSLRQSIQEESARNSGRDLVQRPTNIKMPTATRDQVSRDETGFSISHNHCDDDDADARIGVPSTSKVAGMTVAPFLSKHIPDQYAPLGVTQPVQKDPNTKFCYRHAPDSKCRRTADEPTMEKLQRDLEKMTQSDQQAISHVWSLFSAAPAKHRNLMLQGILTQCCFPQLSYLASSVRDLVRIDFLNALPAEISFKVLCYLDTTSLCKASQVSQKWRLLADDDVVWHKMCEQHIDRKCTKCGWGLPILDQRRLRDDKRRQQLRATGRGLNQWSPKLTPMVEESTEMIRTTSLNSNSKRTSSPSASPESSKRQCTKGLNTDSYFVPTSKPTFRPWKDVYKDRFKVGTNWKYGRYSTKTFKGHTNGVMCLQIDDDILATGSYDTTIKIWNIETGECLRTLRGHTSGVRALQFDDGKLISASLDKTIKVWNWRTGACVTTLGPGSTGNGAGHAQGVLSVNFDGNIVASGSVDKTIIVWNFQDKSAFSLRGHTDWVNAVKVDAASRTIFSASDDLTVRLWDLDTKQTIRTFSGHVGQVQQVVLLPMEFEPENLEVEDDDTSQPSDSPAPDEPLTFAHWPSCRPVPANYMLTGSLDNTVRLWDIHTGRCLKTFFGHVEGVWALAGDSLRAVSGAQDCVVKVWDPRTGACERTITMHEGPVTCIGLSDSTLVTGSEDSTVRVLSFKSDRGPVDEEVELATS